jgi:hypothetical protein
VTKQCSGAQVAPDNNIGWEWPGAWGDGKGRTLRLLEYLTNIAGLTTKSLNLKSQIEPMIVCLQSRVNSATIDLYSECFLDRIAPPTFDRVNSILTKLKCRVQPSHNMQLSVTLNAIFYRWVHPPIEVRVEAMLSLVTGSNHREHALYVLVLLWMFSWQSYKPG